MSGFDFVGESLRGVPRRLRELRGFWVTKQNPIETAEGELTWREAISALARVAALLLKSCKEYSDLIRLESDSEAEWSAISGGKATVHLLE